MEHLKGGDGQGTHREGGTRSSKNLASMLLEKGGGDKIQVRARRKILGLIAKGGLIKNGQRSENGSQG